MALVGLALLVSCGGGGDRCPVSSPNCDAPGGGTPTSQPLVRLELQAPVLALTAIGEVVQISVRGFNATGASVAVPALEWTTSDAEILSVSPNGEARARKDGNASVSARSGSVSATLGFSVSQRVDRVTITGADTLLRAIGMTRDLKAAATDRNGNPVASAVVSWGSSDGAVIAVSGTGRITTRGRGTAVVTATAGVVKDSVSMRVATMRRVPIDPYLATPIAGALWEVPVVLLSYIPTADGVNLDVTKAPDYAVLGAKSLDDVERDILEIYRRKKMALEEGSRFRAYRNPGAQPSLGFRVVEHLVVYDLIPATSRRIGESYVPDYAKAFGDLDLGPLITSRRVRQVWLAQSSFDSSFPSYNPAIHKLTDSRAFWGSNMASPTTGDISSSNRDATDLPIYQHSYIVYGINFRRSQAEAVHNVGHQLEAMLSYATERFEGTQHLFWRKFVGQDASGNFITGRAGWTTMPPNTLTNFDYLNPAAVNSDIEDWRPDGMGAKKPVNVNTWGSLRFSWPGAQDFPQRVETQWYIYWFQSMPGLNNGIPLNSGTMTNWWQFVADWDAAIGASAGLATVRDGQPISIRNDYVGSILLTPGGTLLPNQSVTLYSDVPVRVGVYDCGEPGANGCITDNYTLLPGKSYRVITHPNGPAANLTIVER